MSFPKTEGGIAMSRQPDSADAVVIESRAENGTYIITWSPGTARECTTARDLGELQDLMGRHVPDRVFLDLTLPIRMGVELLRMVRRLAPTQASSLE
jgi:DNA-binding response OmpR family regulator